MATAVGVATRVAAAVADITAAAAAPMANVQPVAAVAVLHGHHLL